MSAFRLDRKSSARRGGRDPNDIVPGSSATSHLYLRLVGSAPAPSMPPAGRLADEEIAVFKAGSIREPTGPMSAMKDGSWWVRTRSVPTQTPFDSGFPHGVDQWISTPATNWSTIALADAAKYERGTDRATTASTAAPRSLRP